jgi:hypothetical protein
MVPSRYDLGRYYLIILANIILELLLDDHDTTMWEGYNGIKQIAIMVSS